MKYKKESARVCVYVYLVSKENPVPVFFQALFAKVPRLKSEQSESERSYV